MDKYIPCRWMTSFGYLRNLATSDIPISGFPGWGIGVGYQKDPRWAKKSTPPVRAGGGGGAGFWKTTWAVLYVRVEWPPPPPTHTHTHTHTLFSPAKYTISSLFSTKFIWLTRFFLIVLLVFSELTAIFVLLPATNGYKKQQAVYEWYGGIFLPRDS